MEEVPLLPQPVLPGQDPDGQPAHPPRVEVWHHGRHKGPQRRGLHLHANEASPRQRRRTKRDGVCGNESSAVLSVLCYYGES
uniref:Uncharacterized protein n=1 Tax=Arcella intermedia TaxID=1963864 RepID=A0A6B2LSL8_9EUKA